MEDDRIISPEEEETIRTRVRQELEERVRRRQLQREEEQARHDQMRRDEEELRIRRDEEMKYYTEHGYVPMGTTMDGSLHWKEGDLSMRKRRRRKKKHNTRRFKPKKYIKEFALAGIFLAILIALIIFYNA